VIKLLTDEHIDKRLIRGLLRREPGLGIVRMQDVGLRTIDDEELLAWAAQEDRVLITYDARTIPTLAYARVLARQHMPGVIILSSEMPLGQVIEELLTVVGASSEGEWESQVLYLPL
jgi:predicted nuclease of predicted toxin-antitoxin system